MDRSPHSFSVTSHESWWSRLKGALAGMIIGLVLFLAAFPLLIFNEGRAVRRATGLGEAATIVVSVSPEVVASENEGALVHVSGRVETGARLEDPDFGVAVPALRLRREVEMYQWRQRREDHEEKKVGGGTETVSRYEYERVWSSSLIDSDRFEFPDDHRNPAAMDHPARDWVATPATLGAFALAASQVERLNDWRPLEMTAETSLPSSVEGRGQRADGGYYLGDPASPQIGDMKITFAAVYPGELTVIAQQSADHLEPYTTSSGAEIELLETGTRTAPEMFESAVASNKVLTWILRAVGFILLFLGITMMLKPLSVVADFFPLVGNLVEAGTGIVALLVAGLFASVTIAVAWIFYRPLLAVGLLAVAAALFWIVRGRLRARSLPGRVTPAV